MIKKQPLGLFNTEQSDHSSDDINVQMIHHWIACMLVNLFLKKKELEPYKILLDILYDPTIPTEFKLVISWNKKASKFLLDDSERDSEEFLNTKLNISSKDLWMDIIHQIINPTATLMQPITKDESFNTTMQKPKPQGMGQHTWDSLKIELFAHTARWLAVAAVPKLVEIEKENLQRSATTLDEKRNSRPKPL